MAVLKIDAACIDALAKKLDALDYEGFASGQGDPEITEMLEYGRAKGWSADKLKKLEAMNKTATAHSAQIVQQVVLNFLERDEIPADWVNVAARGKGSKKAVVEEKPVVEEKAADADEPDVVELEEEESSPTDTSAEQQPPNEVKAEPEKPVEPPVEKPIEPPAVEPKVEEKPVEPVKTEEPDEPEMDLKEKVPKKHGKR